VVWLYIVRHDPRERPLKDNVAEEDDIEEKYDAKEQVAMLDEEDEKVELDVDDNILDDRIDDKFIKNSIDDDDVVVPNPFNVDSKSDYESDDI
jgi:hypothetical protein